MKSSIVGLVFATVLATAAAQKTATTVAYKNSIEYQQKIAAIENAGGSFAQEGNRNLQEKTTPSPVAADLAPMSSAVEYCSNGLPGIDGSNSGGVAVCCPLECGQCGGPGCGSAGLPDYDNTACCVNGVVANQDDCIDTGAAPCINSFPECTGYKPWIGDGYCDENFGLNVAECGYDAGDCCECQCEDGPVFDCGHVGFTCTDPDSPCTDVEIVYCSNGLEGIDGSNSAGDAVCCPTGCGQCGGSSCGSVGLPDYTNEDCCVNGVVSNQGNCADTGSAPCVITETCSNGLPGIEGSNSAGHTVCCPLGCGQCGGSNCGSVGLPDYTNQDCCVNGVANNQDDCAHTGAAPCVITA